jgi:hypothetical protein
LAHKLNPRWQSVIWSARFSSRRKRVSEFAHQNTEHLNFFEKAEIAVVLRIDTWSFQLGCDFSFPFVLKF